jgi:16S rRNA (uracil1498-N3)-methyltransferase
MSRQRFFIPADAIRNDLVTFPQAISHQIAHVLRLMEGNEVTVLDNMGSQFTVRLDGIVEKPPVTGHVLSRSQAVGEPRVKISLYFPMTQRDKLEWILQKGTEVGVASFHPFTSQRSLVQETIVKPGKRERWESILREAAEQSGRGKIPILAEGMALPEALEMALGSHASVLAAWQEASTDLAGVLSGFLSRSATDRALAIFIGAEGGFSMAEIEAMRRRGVVFFTMGRRILRMETAAILAPALALMVLGELGFSE